MSTNDQNSHDKPGTDRRHSRTALICASVVAGMVGLSFAAVPLYDLFCRVTGFGGTTQRAEMASTEVVDRTIKVRFDSNVAPGLDWAFQPEVREVELQIGANGLMIYQAGNTGPTTSVGMATFNVTPLKAGQYFVKVACFCFEEQALEPGQEMDMPVAFYVDPAILDDPEAGKVHTITLSYTFFPAKQDQGPLAAASVGDTETR